jgi:hypothetical protein
MSTFYEPYIRRVQEYYVLRWIEGLCPKHICPSVVDNVRGLSQCLLLESSVSITETNETSTPAI